MVIIDQLGLDILPLIVIKLGLAYMDHPYLLVLIDFLIVWPLI